MTFGRVAAFFKARVAVGASFSCLGARATADGATRVGRAGAAWVLSDSGCLLADHTGAP